MAIGIVGIKRGMTRIFSEDGNSVPVTVIEAEPNRVAQIKTKESDGYAAIQVSSGEVKPSNVTRPLAGHYSCLLYTSPSPRDGLLSRMPSSA